MPREFSEHTERRRYREHDERNEHPEEEEIRESAEKIVRDAVEELERQERKNRMIEEALNDLEEMDAREERVREIAEDSIRELREIEDGLGYEIDYAGEELHDEFVNDMESKLEGPSLKESPSESEEVDESSKSDEASASGESYIEGGDGTLYVVETGTSTEGKASSELEEEERTDSDTTEVSETTMDVPEEPDVDASNEVRNSIIKSDVDDVEDVDSCQPEKQGAAIRNESIDEERTDETVIEEPKRECREQEAVIEHEETEESPLIDEGEMKHETQEANTKEAQEGRVSRDIEIDKIHQTMEELGSEELMLESHEDAEESSESCEDAEACEDGIPTDSLEPPEESEHADQAEEFDNLIEVSEELIQKIEEMLDELELHEDEVADESRVIVEALTGRRHIDKSLEPRPYFLETEEDIEKREHERIREKVAEIFRKLSEEEREKFKECVRARLRNGEDLDAWIREHPSVKASPDFKQNYDAAKKYLKGKRKEDVPRLIRELWSLETERIWTKIVSAITRNTIRKHLQTQLGVDKVTPYSQINHKQEQLNHITESTIIPSFNKSKPIKYPNHTQFEEFLKTYPELAMRNGRHNSIDNALAFIDLMDRKAKGELERISLSDLARKHGLSSHANLSRWLNHGMIPHLIHAYLDNLNSQRVCFDTLPLESKHHFASYSRALKILSQLKNTNHRTSANLEHVISQLLSEKPDSSIVSIDLRGSILRPRWLKEVARFIEQNYDNERIRVGSVGSKLYIWKTEISSSEWIDLYANEYFRFNSSHEKMKLVNTALNHSGLNSRAQLRKLIGSFFKGNVGNLYKQIESKRPYLKGHVLKFILDITEQNLQSIREELHSIGRMRGGRILSPQFPADRLWWSKIAAAVLSDGTMAYDSRHPVCYYFDEVREQVDRIVRILGVLGQVETNVSLNSGLYRLRMPAAIARMLMALGLHSGDKAIVNPRLPDDIRNGSLSIKRANLSVLIVEDGCLHYTDKKTIRISWTRSVALNAGAKSEQYNHESRVDDMLLEFFRGKGNPVKRRLKKSRIDAVEMSEAQLRELAQSKNSIDRTKAEKLLEIIRRNRSKLMDDEVSIAEDLGIRIIVDIPSITYYRKSRRFSVQWRAKTRRIEDAIRYLLLAPPDDKNKRRKASRALQGKSERTHDIAEKLQSEGLEPWAWESEGKL